MNEEDRLKKEQHLNQDFTVMSAGLRTGNETGAEIYFLQQHYRMPTRLLDWSTSPLAALYFACAEAPEADGEFFLLDAYQFNPGTEGICTSRHPVFRKALSAITEWKLPSELGDRIIPVRPDHFDGRIGLQRSCFTFHSPNQREITNSENYSLKSAIIDGGRKNDLLRELSLLGIDHFSIFGDLEHLAGYLVDAYR